MKFPVWLPTGWHPNVGEYYLYIFHDVRLPHLCARPPTYEPPIAMPVVATPEQQVLLKVFAGRYSSVLMCGLEEAGG